MAEDNTAREGSWDNWDRVWKNKQSPEENNTLAFTIAEPKTIFEFWQKGYAQDLLSLVAGKSYVDFLELGSGRGTTSMYLSLEKKRNITMVDLSRDAFELAKKNFETCNLHIPKMILADATNTKLESQSFDCIYNIGLLEHFVHPEEVLKEAFRLLKPGGLIFMPIIPDLPWWSFLPARIIFNPLSVCKPMIKKILGRRDANQDIIRTNYQAKKYCEKAVALGFKNVECMPYNPFPMVVDSLSAQNKIILPIYKWYFNVFKKNRTISFKTSRMFQSAYLLIGTRIE